MSRGLGDVYKRQKQNKWLMKLLQLGNHLFAIKEFRTYLKL
ncbi:hypothetical protein JMUB7532_27420 [Staphylococcus aureus]